MTCDLFKCKLKTNLILEKIEHLSIILNENNLKSSVFVKWHHKMNQQEYFQRGY